MRSGAKSAVTELSATEIKRKMKCILTLTIS